MTGSVYKLRAKVWLYQGESPWHFVTITRTAADKIKRDYTSFLLAKAKTSDNLVRSLLDYNWPRRGFGAIPVKVTIGKTIWKTSIFPGKEGTYFCR